ncbi:MAG: hypothetical protein RLO51_18270 [Thalassobaculum sp.]|uniref:hypothetical protein n=1 Tax=Thalassobaculum sp. TaxID=2022740 RepID=UPI0032EF0B4F
MRTVGAASAEQMAIHGGRSAALEQALRTVAEIDLGAGPKYPAPVVRDLTRTISARAYGRPLLELMHLVRIAEVAGARHGWPAVLFAVPVARAAAFRGVIQEAAHSCRAFGSDFELVEDGVEIVYPDGRFRVTYGRMGFLAALVEFAITALGWRAVDGVLRGWLDDRFALRAAGPHANALSRLLYDHLRDHLPTVQTLRSYRRLTRFLTATRGAGFGLDDMDDTAVLAFWCGEGLEEGSGRGPAEETGDARTFRGALEQMARLRSAFQAGAERRAVDRSVPIGGDRGAGEIDPEFLLDVLEAHDRPGDPLRLLASPPAAAIKFLNGRETEALDLIAALGPQASALPLSILRAETFGAGQARLTQAIRRRAGEAERAAMAALLDCEDYDQRLLYWLRLDGQLRRLSLATMAVLLEAGRAETVEELLAHAPDADLSGLRDLAAARSGSVDGAARFPGRRRPAEAGVDRLVAALADPALAGVRAAGVVAEARAALRAISRRGFRPEERRGPAVADGFVAGAPALRAVRGLLLRVRAAAESAVPPDGRGVRFEADRLVFAGRLRQLYGVPA